MIEKTYNVGIYCRLSNDDERDGESVSIENQKLYLQSEMYTIELPRHMFMWRLQVVCVRFQ